MQAAPNLSFYFGTHNYTNPILYYKLKNPAGVAAENKCRYPDIAVYNNATF